MFHSKHQTAIISPRSLEQSEPGQNWNGDQPCTHYKNIAKDLTFSVLFRAYSQMCCKAKIIYLHMASVIKARLYELGGFDGC